MYYDDRVQGWCEDDGTFIAYIHDLHMNRQTVHEFIRARDAAADGLKTLLDFLRDNDGVLFYDKDTDSICLAINNNNAFQRILSVGAAYTSCSPTACDNGESFASEFIRLAIQSLLEKSQHGDKTDV